MAPPRPLAAPLVPETAPAPDEPLPVPDRARLARLMEEAERAGELAPASWASEETHPLTDFSPREVERLYAKLQRTRNAVAWHEERARQLGARLAQVGMLARDWEELEVERSRSEAAAAGGRAYLEKMAPKLAAAGMAPIPAPQPGWVPPQPVHHSHDEEEHEEEGVEPHALYP